MGEVKKFIVSSIALIMMISLVSVSVKADSSNSVGRHYISNASDDSSVDFTGFLKSCSDRELEQQAADYENLSAEFVSDILNQLNNPNSKLYSNVSRAQLIKKYNYSLGKITSFRDELNNKLSGLNPSNFTNNSSVLHDLLCALNDEEIVTEYVDEDSVATSKQFNFDGIITGDPTTVSVDTSSNNNSTYPTNFRTLDYQNAIESYEDDNGIVDDANTRIPNEAKSALYKHILALEKEVNDLTTDDNNSKKQISDLSNEITTLKQSSENKTQDIKTAPSNVQNTNNSKDVTSNEKHQRVAKKHQKKLSKKATKKVQEDKKAIAKLNKKLKGKHLSKKQKHSLTVKRAQLIKAVRKLTK
ncbi:hypothetical protein RZ71_09860 [Apilactobacillus kunkeei]|uniref:Uncharacterized protein n=1 Tax=Apilactobacillus kunkeei TaxID=148814 RepID=A0A0M9DDY5_9LACO|nr:hypothetical protein [Apilactobacillus kunkeei]KOY77080.1 hypothetical protein RZ71_09860 [Apilactobacillus kunkeei]